MAIGVIALIAIVYYLVNPALCRWMPKCAFHSLTGLSCPGCGVQRAAHAVLNGNFAEAAHRNFFLLLSLPYFAGVCWGSVSALPYSRQAKKIFCNRYAAMAYIIAFFLWWIVRNIIGI